MLSTTVTRHRGYLSDRLVATLVLAGPQWSTVAIQSATFLCTIISQDDNRIRAGGHKYLHGRVYEIDTADPRTYWAGGSVAGMKRRELLATGAGAGAAALAGCTSMAQLGGQLEARWEFQWEGLLRSMDTAVIVTTGQVRNVGDGGGGFDLLVELLDSSGETRQDTEIAIEGLAPDEEQQFWAKFVVRERLDTIETVDVSAPALDSG